MPICNINISIPLLSLVYLSTGYFFLGSPMAHFVSRSRRKRTKSDTESAYFTDRKFSPIYRKIEEYLPERPGWTKFYNKDRVSIGPLLLLWHFGQRARFYFIVSTLWSSNTTWTDPISKLYFKYQRAANRMKLMKVFHEN